jgi:hypothetical protein
LFSCCVCDKKALDESWIEQADGYITFKIKYSDLEKYICITEGDNYGVIVMGFELSVTEVQFGSTESSKAPTVNLVYTI